MGLLDGVKDLVMGNKTPSTTVQQAIPQLKKKVLIIEDEEVLRSLYSEILRAENFEVEAVEDGSRGLNKLVTFKPDLVLLDLMMPVMDGKTMLRSMRALPEFKDLPVIVLTNAGDTDSMRETKFYNNASAFLIKANVTPQDIVNQVKTFIFSSGS